MRDSLRGIVEVAEAELVIAWSGALTTRRFVARIGGETLKDILVVWIKAQAERGGLLDQDFFRRCFGLIFEEKYVALLNFRVLVTIEGRVCHQHGPRVFPVVRNVPFLQVFYSLSDADVHRGSRLRFIIKPILEDSVLLRRFARI